MKAAMNRSSSKPVTSPHPAPGDAVDDRRQQIMAAALHVFAKRGLAGAKMSMIAEAAGISQGLSYRYFSSKEELFTSLVDQALTAARAAVAGIAALPGSPREQFVALTRTMLAGDHRLYFLLIQQAQTDENTPPEAKQLLERYGPEEMFSHLLPVFVKGQQREEFSAGDPQRLLMLYFSVVTGLMLQDAPADPDYWVGEADTLIKLLAP